jgi:hypothetical protein
LVRQAKANTIEITKGIKKMSRKKKQDTPEQGFDFAKHERVGYALKLVQQDLDKVKAELNYFYPASSDKDIKVIEVAIEKVRLLQGIEHSRLIAEYPDKDDDELLPVYLGRLGQKVPYETAPKTDQTAESDTQSHDSETDPLLPDVESLPSNGSSDLVVDQELTDES